MEAFADELIELRSLEDVLGIIDHIRNKPYLFLGGGSNVLFIQNFRGTVLLNRIAGYDVQNIDDNHYQISAYSGSNWHEFVLWTIENGYYGLENLSLIPGTVGAAPMQNIGAYGVEIKDCCIGLEAIHLQTGQKRYFTAEECQFGYRESVFKRELQNQYFIYRVDFKLSKNADIKISYGAIQDTLIKNGIMNPTHRDVSNAVIAIRSSKLPNPSDLGNAGSFFKNPVVSQDMADEFLKNYPLAPHYKDSKGVKIPAGWLIEQCGFKGYREGNVGSHRDQALVIVNYEAALGSEIYNYSQKIIDEVKKRFNFVLEREVNMIGLE